MYIIITLVSVILIYYRVYMTIVTLYQSLLERFFFFFSLKQKNENYVSQGQQILDVTLLLINDNKVTTTYSPKSQQLHKNMMGSQ